MKKKFLKLSLFTLIIGLLFLLLAFFVFHYVTDEGITLVWHAEANKPFITELFGDFGVLNLATSLVSLLIALIFYKKEK